jgi:hypothetical protein
MNLNCTSFLWHFLTLRIKVVTICTTYYNATCEVYKATGMDNIVLWDMTSCSLQDRYQILGENAASIIKSEDGRSRFLQNVDNDFSGLHDLISQKTLICIYSLPT